METIFIIPKELEYLKGLVKLARQRKDVETTQSQVVVKHGCSYNQTSLHQQNSL